MKKKKKQNNKNKQKQTKQTNKHQTTTTNPENTVRTEWCTRNESRSIKTLSEQNDVHVMSLEVSKHCQNRMMYT